MERDETLIYLVISTENTKNRKILNAVYFIISVYFAFSVVIE